MFVDRCQKDNDSRLWQSAESIRKDMLHTDFIAGGAWHIIKYVIHECPDRVDIVFRDHRIAYFQPGPATPQIPLNIS